MNRSMTRAITILSFSAALSACGESLPRTEPGSACGDGVCQRGESCTSCAADCASCPTECTPETDAALCARDTACGAHDAIDRCGTQRRVECGSCEPECAAETDAELCARGDACGSVVVIDRCGAQRAVDCAACPSTEAVQIPFAPAGVDLAGSLSEFDAAPAVQVSAGAAAATFRLLWDHGYLYLAAAVADADLRDNGAGEDGALWETDSVELLLDPQHLRSAGPDGTFRHLIVSARGARYDSAGAAGVGDSSFDLQGLSVRAAPAGTFNDAVADTGYRIALRIPWSALFPEGRAPAGGLPLGADLALNAVDASSSATRDWAGLSGSFAQPALWRELVLGAAGPCVAESNEELCARLGKDCDAVDAFDRCGTARAVHCGTCTAPKTCGGAGTPNVCGEAPVTAPGIGAGTDYRPAYLTGVTGGGEANPCLTAAEYVAPCVGDGVADDTRCLADAAVAARDAQKVLALPVKGPFYRVTGPITIFTSVCGVGGMPTIKQTNQGNSWISVNSVATHQQTIFILAPGMTGWIFNLHLVGTFDGGNAVTEHAHNINVGSVDGVTIKGNLFENPMGDGIATDANRYDGGSIGQNVLVDGNTFRNPYRCAVGFVHNQSNWAILNNVIDKQVNFVSGIDIEPEGQGKVLHVEIAHNEFVMNNRTTNPARDADGKAIFGWGVPGNPAPGGDFYLHHNYGTFGTGFGYFGGEGTWGYIYRADNAEGP